MKVGKKTGDTLVEVMFAVAIFSLVAISAVAVMNSGLSNTQATLESTMARTEIDAQAEALRFIQSSYVAERRDGADTDGYYATLWHKIVARANDPTEAATQYGPTSCAELYNHENNSGIYKLNGFAINVRKIGLSDDAEESLIKQDEKFFAPATHPRIIYDDDALLDNTNSSEAERVEGIFVTAVKDPGSTKVDDTGVKSGAVYYDFYIRTCWYASGKDLPTTISTVIRLYDPDVVAPSE
jgi:Tfp pilus assembly protein PilE